MPRPKGGYRLADDTRVPGVTTITGIDGSGKEGLIHWAWQRGFEDQVDYRELRDVAGGIGTAVHFGMEYELKGREYDPAVLLRDKVLTCVSTS